MANPSTATPSRVNRFETDEEASLPARLSLVDEENDEEEALPGEMAAEDLVQVGVHFECSRGQRITTFLSLAILQGIGKRRSSMLRQAKAEQVKCDLPCFDEEDDGIPPFCRHELCPLDHRNKW